ncbi:MAG: flagellar protein [Lachnospiraceae bacterium]|nr:flagellar protein [Lachnospiraceae bacterium]
MNQIQQSFLSNLQIQDQYLSTQKTTTSPMERTGTISFQDMLARKAQEMMPLKFSKHAANRLADRNIELTNEQMDRLAMGTQKAGVKGIKDSLVMIDDLAFIVNIPNKTVVTAIDQTQADENIFTNIDGAVIV